ncbi:MAG: D-threo-aldose 1-dehydrogenase [Arenicella sp.]|jgi:D-threo-aldose 1-dehydrogenase
MTIPARRKIGNTKLTVDTLGFGCAPLGNLYRPINDLDAGEILQSALQAGFHYFDTAPHYGQGLSERRTGDLLRPLQGKGYVLSTKVGRLLKPAGYADERHGFVSPMPFDIHYDYSYDGIMRSFEDSLMRLGLDHIDILLMHDIGQDTHGAANKHHFPIAMDGGYKAMDELRTQGLVGAIGLGVNEYQVCEKAMQYGHWDCFLLAGRYSLLEQDSLHTFLPKCEQNSSSVIIGGPYNSGILATGVHGKSAPYYNYQPASNEIIKKVAQIETVCAEFNVTLAAAALQFPLYHSVVASVIPGLGNKRRIHETMELFHEVIPSEFWQTLKQNELINQDSPVSSI